MVRRGDMLDTSDVIEILAIDLIGIVPEDEGVIVSVNKGIPIILDERNRAGLAFRNIAQRLLGKEVPFMAIKGLPSLLEHIHRLMRR
jgi:septum site-determining protein MinD